ncbi:hypothetical protein KPG71_12870 [Roseovarius sp. PS-C2]|nr:hypothetical protein [Roseovarius sp. PS-C2]MBU3260908.1 hypothetical protein [Roseovarius sp. PS-C2]
MEREAISMKAIMGMISHREYQKRNNLLLLNRFPPSDGSDHSAANIKALF